MDLQALLSNPMILTTLVPVAAIVGWVVVSMAKHRERMAMIERGMNPDQLKIDRKRQ